MFNLSPRIAEELSDSSSADGSVRSVSFTRALDSEQRTEDGQSRAEDEGPRAEDERLRAEDGESCAEDEESRAEDEGLFSWSYAEATAA